MRQQDSRVGDRDRWLGLGLGPRTELLSVNQSVVSSSLRFKLSVWR